LPPASGQGLEAASGVVRIAAATADKFVPQMVNFEVVGGVNFKKGCYPGQEVVARSQFRGTLKRRAFLVHCDSALAAGQEVFHDSDAEQPCGLVAQAAPAPAGGWDAIVSMQVAAADHGRLAVGAAAGPTLSLLPLPYLLMTDI
jgi:folate-binding protein YgfZ